MASTTTPNNNNNPYAYQKPSTLATRTLVTGETPTTDNKPPNHYSEAVRAAGQSQPKNETTGAVPTGDTDRPGLDRQQSWSMQDRKRDHTTSMLSGTPSGHGYSTTSN